MWKEEGPGKNQRVFVLGAWVIGQVGSFTTYKTWQTAPRIFRYHHHVRDQVCVIRCMARCVTKCVTRCNHRVWWGQLQTNCRKNAVKYVRRQSQINVNISHQRIKSRRVKCCTRCLDVKRRFSKIVFLWSIIIPFRGTRLLRAFYKTKNSTSIQNNNCDEQKCRVFKNTLFVINYRTHESSEGQVELHKTQK